MLYKDISFKSRFVEENPENFMMQYETFNSQQYLEHSKKEYKIKHENERKMREVEWLEKHGIDPQLVYPGWTPAKVSQMYRLGKRKPKPKEPEIIIPEEPKEAPPVQAKVKPVTPENKVAEE